MIRRTIVIGLLTLVALALGLPALVGLYLARAFDQTVARVDAQDALRVVSSQFERGWFGSDATLRIALEGPLCAAPPCANLTLTSRIHHGPLVFGAPADSTAGLRPSLGVADTRLALSDLWPRLVFEPTLPAARVITRVGFDGRARSSLELGGASVAVSRQRPLAHIDMDTISGAWAQPLRGGGALQGSLGSPALRLVGVRAGQLVWRGLRVQRSRPDTQNLAVTRLELASLNMADGQGAAGRVSALEARWQPLVSAGERDDALEQTRLKGDFDISAAQLAFDNSQVGPVVIEGGVRGVDTAAARTLFAQIGALDDADAGANPDVRATIYGQTLPVLLSHAASLQISRLHVITPDGDIDGHLRIEAPESLRPVRLLADVIAQLDVDLSLAVPTPIARDLATQMMIAGGRSPYALEEADIDTALAELVADGLIQSRPQERAYGVVLTVHNGRLRLNERNQIGWQSVVDQFEAARSRL